MDIEDEIQARVCWIKSDFLHDEQAQDIAKLIYKSRSAPSMSKAMWYLAWADSLVHKVRMKVDEIFLCHSELYKTG